MVPTLKRRIKYKQATVKTTSNCKTDYYNTFKKTQNSAINQIKLN